MAQLDVFRNPDPEFAGHAPYLLVLQHDMHRTMKSRIVIPLVLVTDLSQPFEGNLCPRFRIEDQEVFASLPELFSFPSAHLVDRVTNLSEKRLELFSALDLLLNGF